MAKRPTPERFVPRNPAKYRGNPSNIISRSSWERKMMSWLDTHPGIEWWNSEEVVVNYFDKASGKVRRYFPDFVFKKSGGETIMVEVKPWNQTQPPEQKRGKTKATYLNEVMTYATNTSKWQAAEEFCKKKNWKFQVVTERDLKI